MQMKTFKKNDCEKRNENKTKGKEMSNDRTLSFMGSILAP